jgi:hypothetical protein
VINVSQISWKKGFQSGIHTSWVLGKVIFPVTLLISILQYTPLIKTLSSALTPVMQWIGLPGEAALPLILGNLINIYAGIGAILSISLTEKQVFILVVMLCISHNLVLESVICRKIGVNPFFISSFRFLTSVFFGWLIQIGWNGGSALAKYGLVSLNQEIPGEWTEIFMQGLKKASMSTLQFCLIAIPLMILIQILQDIDFLNRFTKWMRFFVKPLGIDPRGSITITSVLLIGLMFAAGLIIQQVKEKKFEKRDLIIIMIFLAICHAIVEDTVIFVPLNTYLFPLLLIRFSAAMVFSLLTAWILLPKSRSGNVRMEKTGSG